MSGSDPVHGVLFDMDGVLLDSETLSLKSFTMAASALGHDMGLDFALTMIGLPGDACARLVTDTFGPEIDVARLFDTQKRFLHELVQAGGLTLKSGVLPLLDYLDERRMPCAVATSSGRKRTEMHLRHVGILDRFNAIITRDDVMSGKPDPEPYLRAAQAIGIAPRFCLAVEDSHTGARAAHAAAVRVIVVPDLLMPNEEIRAKAHAVMENLDQVRAFIERER